MSSTVFAFYGFVFVLILVFLMWRDGHESISAVLHFSTHRPVLIAIQLCLVLAFLLFPNSILRPSFHVFVRVLTSLLLLATLCGVYTLHIHHPLHHLCAILFLLCLLLLMTIGLPTQHRGWIIVVTLVLLGLAKWHYGVAEGLFMAGMCAFLLHF
ncbi:hypothetical protein EBZ80_15990 [bacterium]|nr:hypothetical protein [bacterium]